MEVNIRVAKVEELESVIALQTLSILNPLSKSREYSKAQINAIIEHQAKIRIVNLFDETIFLAEYNNQLAGFASGSNMFAQITGIYVHPDLMRKGIGRKLLVEIELFYIEKRRKVIWVASSLEAVGFYQQNGYRIQQGFISGMISLIRRNFFSFDPTEISTKLLTKELIPTSQIKRLFDKISLIASIVILTIALIKLAFG
jgi:GNAT superfamily N-acetyltransferase